MSTNTYRDLYPKRKQWDEPSWFDTCADLSEGHTDDDSVGCTTDNGMYICTRPSDHEGPHVADDGISVIAVWED